MNKDDIERLRKIVDGMDKYSLDRVMLLADDVDALVRLIARLDQPYQQEERIEVALKSAWGKYPIIVSFLWADPDGGVWCRKVGTISHAIYYPYHRPVPQTVPAELPRELVERLRKKCSLALTEHPTLLECDLDAAIAASQEGEDK